MSEESPALHIERHRAELASLSVESRFLDAVAQIPPLADSDEPQWADPRAWDNAYRLIAAADVVGVRGWRAAVGPIYERAALGDLFGLMQSIRHGPENAFGDDVNAFADVLEPLTQHSRAGSREWSVRALGILRELRSLPFLIRATDDLVAEVKREARLSIRMLAQRHAEAAAALEALS